MPPGSHTTPAALEPQRLLLIDDDRKLCRLMVSYLTPLGYDVVVAHSGQEGLARISESWKAVLLDFMLPGMDGMEVLRRIRLQSHVPVLMLTARGEEPDRIAGLELGADDYLPKTMSTQELVARLRAVIRRSYLVPQAPAPPTGVKDRLAIGPLHIHPGARSVTLHGHPLTLTPVEFDLLLCLGRFAGRVKTREELLSEIRKRHYEIFDRSIDVHISALRKKLGDDPKCPRFIRTARSAGYCLIDPHAVLP